MFKVLLESENIKLQPLQNSDFERLFAVASDPKIWEQHPNKDRWKRDVFENFFDGAMKSGNAFLIIDKKSGEVAGSTRFYDFNEEENSILIGYTFYGTKFWGSGMNAEVKKLMLDYIFTRVDLVKFHVGKENFRSRRAMEKLGAKFQQEITVAYFGEPDRENVEYRIYKKDYLDAQPSSISAPK